MTSIANSAETNSVQAPGGARVGSAALANLTFTGEITTRNSEVVVRSLPHQAGGLEGTHRAFRIVQGRSPKNGETVACRGAGRSARIPFCDGLIEFIVSGGRMPGGVRLPENPLC